MESKVEMTLGNTLPSSIIKENERLKTMLRNCKRQLKEKAEDAVMRYTIDNLPMEKGGIGGKLIDRF